MFPDFMKTQKPNEPTQQTLRSVLTRPVVQDATQEWLDNLMRYHAERGRSR
jgi:hypothetical protein